MSLLKGLRELTHAYNTRDWDRVLSSYEEIAGEPLEQEEREHVTQKVTEDIHLDLGEKPIKKKPGRPKKSEKVQDDTVPVLVSQREDSFIGSVKKPAGSEVRWGGNSFVDDKTECLDDIAIDKKLKKGLGGKGWKKPSARPKHEFLKLNCDLCKKVFEVDPSVVGGDSRKICNRCLGKKSKN